MDEPYVLVNGVEKSKSDERDYKIITLPNKLEVLLVSDPATDKAAAGMDVNVGHFSDPEEIPGLAHFLEHMLFLGTEKYPDENSYSAYLNENGGRSNAYTSMENTNYFFDVTYPHLKEALDRFAQFFIAPLFTASATDRELNAVDSEHSKNVQDDNWRMFQLEKSTSSPSHPYHKFATGNSTTLRTTPAEKGIDVRDALVKFHDRYYSANRMKLVVLGREPLALLEEWVREMFSSVANTDAPPPRYKGAPFTPEQLGRRVDVVPVKDLRTIELTWPMDSMQAHYEEAPQRYVSNLIGHEGPGSILSLLKRKGWANELGASLAFNNSDFAMFKVNIEATDLGMAHVDDIVAVVFDYVRMMRAAGPQEWLWREISTQYDCEFRFKSDSNPFNFVSSAAANLHKYPPRHVLSGPYLTRRFDAALIGRIVERLLPANCQVQVAHQSVDQVADQVEPWYGTRYAISPLSPEQLARWGVTSREFPELHLPSENEFLPTDFRVYDFTPPAPKRLSVAKESALNPAANSSALTRTLETQSVFKVWAKEEDDTRRPPIVVMEDERARVWFKQDASFKRPKLALVLAIRSPAAYETPLNSVLAELYTFLMQDALTEFAYAAEIAGLNYNLQNNVTGLSLTIGGFHHKLDRLAEKVIHSMLNPDDFTEEQFQRFKEVIHKQYLNWDKEQPYNHALYNMSYMINVPRWHVQEKLKVIDDLVLQDILDFVPKLYEEAFLELLVHGNATPKTGMELATKIISAVSRKPLQQSRVPIPRVVKLDQLSQKFCLIRGPDALNPNSAVETLFQIGLETRKLEALLILLAHIAQEPAFNILRTEEQLGYIVFCGTRNDAGAIALRLIIQSSKADPVTLDSRIEAFLVRFKETLQGLSDDAFAANVNAVVSTKLEKDKTLSGETRRWWVEIDSQTYAFSRSFEVARQLKKATKQDLLDFFNDYIAVNAPQRRKLCVGIVSGPHAAALEPVENPSATLDPLDTRAIPTKETLALVQGEYELLSDLTKLKSSAEMYPARPQVGKL